jgi:hypothetical protein
MGGLKMVFFALILMAGAAMQFITIQLTQAQIYLITKTFSPSNF